MCSKSVHIIFGFFKTNFAASKYVETHAKCLSSYHLPCRTLSHSQLRLTNEIPCDVLKSYKNGSFRYDKDRLSIFQFKSSPLIHLHEIPTAKGELLNLDWLNNADITNQELIERLHFVINYCNMNDISISSQDFDVFVDNFTCKLVEFTENELIASLQVFSKVKIDNPKLSSRNFAELLMALDENCSRKASDWDTDKRLTVCEVWKAVPLGRKSKFGQLICEKLVSDLKFMHPDQFLQAMRIINFLNNFIENGLAFEPQFERVIDALSLEDMASLCFTFNRLDYQIDKTDLVDKIFRKTMDGDVTTLSDVALIQLLQTIRLSYRAKQIDTLSELIKNLRSEIAHRPLFVCLPIILVGENYRTHDPESIEIVIQKASANFNSFKLIYMEQLCLALAVFGYTSQSSQELLANILKALPSRTNQIARAPKKFLSLVYYLAVLGYPNNELIHNALRNDFLVTVYNHKRFFPPEVFQLNIFTKLNLMGSYKGSHLNEKNSKVMHKLAADCVDIRNQARNYRFYEPYKTLLQISDILVLLKMPHHFGHALPHYETPDIYLVFDKDTKEVSEFKTEFPVPCAGQITTKGRLMGESNLDVVAIVISKWKDLCRIKKTPNAFFEVKIQQLKLAGFYPIHVSYYDWLPLNDDERKDFIQNKLEFLNKKNNI